MVGAASLLLAARVYWAMVLRETAGCHAMWTMMLAAGANTTTWLPLCCVYSPASHTQPASASEAVPKHYAPGSVCRYLVWSGGWRCEGTLGWEEGRVGNGCCAPVQMWIDPPAQKGSACKHGRRVAAAAVCRGGLPAAAAWSTSPGRIEEVTSLSRLEPNRHDARNDPALEDHQ